ncbi:hypothetical protein B0T20DRAFT_482202 [Sordaria brevicollis]|uniref:Uncharacterized protein n=1 Tax=Sordaria brevicollis TaxID=83679 RepID=A0AAE0P9N4_SORBR|nr:hypothetical protein B0T20DRAFT_482202 [Sordaria brevicollis]
MDSTTCEYRYPVYKCGKAKHSAAPRKHYHCRTGCPPSMWKNAWEQTQESCRTCPACVNEDLQNGQIAVAKWDEPAVNHAYDGYGIVVPATSGGGQQPAAYGGGGYGGAYYGGGGGGEPSSYGGGYGGGGQVDPAAYGGGSAYGGGGGDPSASVYGGGSGYGGQTDPTYGGYAGGGGYPAAPDPSGGFPPNPMPPPLPAGFGGGGAPPNPNPNPMPPPNPAAGGINPFTSGGNRPNTPDFLKEFSRNKDDKGKSSKKSHKKKR